MSQLSFGVHSAPWHGEEKSLYSQGFGGHIGYDSKGEDQYYFNFTIGFTKYKGAFGSIPAPINRIVGNSGDSIVYSDYYIIGRFFSATFNWRILNNERFVVSSGMGFTIDMNDYKGNGYNFYGLEYAQLLEKINFFRVSGIAVTEGYYHLNSKWSVGAGIQGAFGMDSDD